MILRINSGELNFTNYDFVGYRFVHNIAMDFDGKISLLILLDENKSRLRQIRSHVSQQHLVPKTREQNGSKFDFWEFSEKPCQAINQDINFFLHIPRASQSWLENKSERPRIQIGFTTYM